MSSVHQPVLLNEVLAQLGEDPQGVRFIFDGTLGGGGHSEALLERFPEAFLVGTDRDAKAVERTAERLKRFSKRCFLATASFDQIGATWEMLPESVRGARQQPQFDRLLLDLGISSDQLDDSGRGFTFHGEGPLDMRMDPTSGETAEELLNRASENDLKRIFLRGGVHRLHAAALARETIRQRPISGRRAFAELCDRTAPAAEKHRASGRRRNPATLPFQSLRIEVNDELGVLQRFLSAAPELLSPGARLAVISFHSLEDKYVTQAMRRWSRPSQGDLRRPGPAFGALLTKNAVLPSEAEASANPRARSARMRVFERAKEVG